jgi:hypothetical protein
MQGYTACQLKPAHFRLGLSQFPAVTAAFHGRGGAVIFIFLSRGNPVKYTDPDGKYLITSKSANEFARQRPSSLYQIQGIPALLVQQGNIIAPIYISVIKFMHPEYKLQLGNGLDSALQNVTPDSEFITTSLTTNAEYIGSGVYQINLTVTTMMTDSETGEITTSSVTGDIAYATSIEAGAPIAGAAPNKNIVNSIVNEVLEIAEINIRISEQL